MFCIEHIRVLLLAPVAGLLAWWLVARGRRGHRIAGLCAALSAALMVVALAGIFAGEGSALRVFLIDDSASTRGAATALLPQVRAAASRMGQADRIAIVAFGRDASVLVPPTPVAALPAELPRPAGIDQDGTSIEAALELALRLFPQGAAGDVVLVTDGRANSGSAAALGAQFAAADRPIHSLTLAVGSQNGAQNDAWVAAVRAPSSVAAGQPIDFEIVVGAASPMHGTLELQINGRMLARPQPLDIVRRRTVLARRVVVDEPGLYTLTVRLRSANDAAPENNEASAAVRVRGKLNVTYVSSSPGRALAGVLAQSKAVKLRRAAPAAIDPTNREMLRSDVVVLDNVSAEKLGAGRIAWLRRFVSDAGRGLVVFGGPDSFGPGGYAGTPLADLLPVDPDPEQRAARQSSVVIVADRSGSMREEIGGRQKIEFVREAVLRAGKEFGAKTGARADELSVVAFNQAPDVLLERRQVGSSAGAAAIRSAVGRIFPSGKTNIGRALDAARAILAKTGLARHIILVSDGRSQDKLDGARIGADMKAGGAVFSVLATGAVMNDGLKALETAARTTKGRFVMLKAISELPAAMARETRTIAGSLVRKGTFTVERGPGSWLGEVAAPPPIGGYVLTGARPEAPPILVTGDAPVLATWRRGLGRVVACTTSPEDWASEWTAASPAVFEGLVLWAGASDRQHEVAVGLDPKEDRVRITAESAKDLGDRKLVASFFSPGGDVAKLDMKQVGRRRYECWAGAGRRGTYLAKISSTTAGTVLGEAHVTVGYSAEWRPGADASVARRLSHTTSGVVLDGLGGLPPVKRSTSPAGARRGLGYILLCLAGAVFIIGLLR